MRIDSMRQQVTVVQVIQRHFMELLHATSDTALAFFARVREHYEASFLEDLRSIEFSSHADAYRRMVRDAEMGKRYLDKDADARLPAELVESIIAAFPAGRRFALQLELAERQGLLAVPMPQAAPSEDGANLGRIGKEVGEMIIRVSGLLADGKIDALDRDAAPDALRDIDEAMAVILEMRERIKRQALGEEVDSNVVPIGRAQA